jgi:anti-sigma-K factor RskA
MADAMSCEESTDLLALDAVGALEADEHATLERHIATCATCRPLAAQYADVASLLPAALEPVPPPARLRRRLMAQVYGEATGGAPQPWWRRLVAAIPSNRALTAAGALAVAAAIALLIWGMSERHVASPVAYTVAGSTAQPAVTGTLTVDTAGTQSILTVHGLVAPPADEVYEVWLVPTHGSPKGVAFLSPDPSGGAWTAVVNGSLAGYETIAATNEPRGGSPGPTGTEVLSGQLGES